MFIVKYKKIFLQTSGPSPCMIAFIVSPSKCMQSSVMVSSCVHEVGSVFSQHQEQFVFRGGGKTLWEVYVACVEYEGVKPSAMLP